MKCFEKYLLIIICLVFLQVFSLLNIAAYSEEYVYDEISGMDVRKEFAPNDMDFQVHNPSLNYPVCTIKGGTEVWIPRNQLNSASNKLIVKGTLAQPCNFQVVVTKNPLIKEMRTLPPGTTFHIMGGGPAGGAVVKSFTATEPPPPPQSGYITPPPPPQNGATDKQMRLYGKQWVAHPSVGVNALFECRGVQISEPVTVLEVHGVVPEGYEILVKSVSSNTSSRMACFGTKDNSKIAGNCAKTAVGFTITSPGIYSVCPYMNPGGPDTSVELVLGRNAK